jgi:hypothetical protein
MLVPPLIREVGVGSLYRHKVSFALFVQRPDPNKVLSPDIGLFLRIDLTIDLQLPKHRGLLGVNNGVFVVHNKEGMV